MARIVLNRPLVKLTAQSRALPLVRKTTRQVLAGARRLAPSGDHRSGSGQRKAGRTLSQSLTSSMRVGALAIVSQVGSSKAYAASMHQGSDAHVIPLRQGRRLKFRWERGAFLVAGRGGRPRRGQFFFFVKVRHPGNKRPVRYLTTPMVQFGRANGFSTSTSPVSRSRLP